MEGFLSKQMILLFPISRFQSLCRSNPDKNHYQTFERKRIMNRFFVLTVLLVFTGLNGFFITQSIAAFGDCNDALNEANASCTGVVDCSDGQCFLINTSCTGGYTCNPDPCTAAKSDKIKKFGACENTYWDYGCFHCSFYYCHCLFANFI